MTGRRREHAAVIARPVVRVLAIAIALLALGNLLVIGVMLGWLRNTTAPSALHDTIFLVSASGVLVLASVVAVLAWLWSR